MSTCGIPGFGRLSPATSESDGCCGRGCGTMVDCEENRCCAPKVGCGGVGIAATIGLLCLPHLWHFRSGSEEGPATD